MQLNDNFYHYTLHQHRQDPNHYPSPTLEKFRATIAWPGDMPIFQEEVGPADAQRAAQRDKGKAKENEEISDLVDYLIGGN